VNDPKNGNEPKATEETIDFASAVDGLSRRGALGVGATAGLALMIDSILAGCKVRTFNAKQSSSARSSGPDLSGLTVVEALLGAFPTSFIDTWKDIGDRPSAYPSIESERNLVGLLSVLRMGDAFKAPPPGGVSEAAKASALRSLLVLFRTRTNPIGLQKELMRAGVDVVHPGGVGVAMLLSHKLVTEVALNPNNVVKGTGTSGRLLFTLGAYRPQMSDLTRHYMLCDDDVARHNDEKKYQHQHAVKPEDARIVAEICHTAAVDLVNTALDANEGKGRPGVVDIVSDVARWIPMKVVNSYFGLPCGADAPPIKMATAEEKALYAGLLNGSDELQVSEDLMYRWIANGFRNLFLNLSRDPTVSGPGNLAGAQLVYYIYRNVRATPKSGSSKDTMLARLVSKMTDKDNPMLTGVNAKQGSPDHLVPLLKVTTKAGVELELATMMTDIAAYRTSAQIAGSVAGAGVTIEEAIARVFEVLLSPDEGAFTPSVHLKECIKIAKEKSFEDAVPLLLPYFYEALRFKPQAELVPRVVGLDESDKVAHNAIVSAVKALTEGSTSTNPFASSVQVELQGGTLALACLYAAMHDSKVVSAPEPPEVFSPLRPRKHYLHFGWSHPGNTDLEAKSFDKSSSSGNACLGRYMAPMEVVAAMWAVFNRVGSSIALVAPAGTPALVFQKAPPLPTDVPTFDLKDYVFNPGDEAERKAGASPFPARLEVVLQG
jgi:cytochrome P450